MPRPIEHRAASTHPATPVYAALTDEAFLRARLAKLGGRNSALTAYSTRGDTTRYALRQTLDAEHVPALARALVHGDLVIDRSESWTAANGRYTGEIHAHVPGTPGSVTCTMLLADTAAGSELVLTGSVKVSVPLVGGKLEALIVEHLVRLLRAEARFTQRWLESRDAAF